MFVKKNSLFRNHSEKGPLIDAMSKNSITRLRYASNSRLAQRYISCLEPSTFTSSPFLTLQMKFLWALPETSVS